VIWTKIPFEILGSAQLLLCSELAGVFNSHHGSIAAIPRLAGFNELPLRDRNGFLVRFGIGDGN
jgi:hypothetical protein